MDAPKTIAVQKTKYGDFMHQHGNDEIFDLTPTREQLSSYKAQSSFIPNNYGESKAESVLRNRAQKRGMEIFNDELSATGNQELGINHFLKKGRASYLRTLNNTLDNPDISFSQNGRNYSVKKYTGKETGKNFFDFVIEQDGKLFDKFPVKKDSYIFNQLTRPTQNLSLSGDRLGILEPTSGMTNLWKESIPRRGVVVNKNLLQHKP